MTNKNYFDFMISQGCTEYKKSGPGGGGQGLVEKKEKGIAS